ncbi:hypothetical protein [Streptomyces gibsoniae]|uniref:Uncharacterized protein n=1 Tax=Streptomyces gibsoniae TaxID=3075529 RepID=A0ABU2U1L4_9ACTN|nr:hypothetical protein [Streptomyces sp. DSM 41699]MDT0467118.1 hypothetical protein [Streptomyces sp. DSM 41699]
MDHHSRRQRRAVSRDEARRTARPNPTPGKNRAERRALRYRPSAEITYHRSQASATRRRALDKALRQEWARAGRAGQYPSGQKRINHKRSVREQEFLDWATRRLTQLDQEGTREAA